MVRFEEVEVGKELPSFSVTIDEVMYRQYNRLVHEVNPLHFNENYAKGLGYRTIVVAGVFTASFFLRPILAWIEDPARIMEYTIRFNDPVYLGDTITHRTIVKRKYEGKGKRIVECEVTVENQEREKLTSGLVLVNF